MNNIGRLCFQNYTFPYNPESFCLICAAKMAVHPTPEGFPLVCRTGWEAREVQGEGAFVGEAAQEFYERLLALFEKPESGSLTLPHGIVFPAFFTKLSLTGDGKEGILRYSFSFLEDTNEREAVL